MGRPLPMIPTEFRYFDRIERPYARRLRRALSLIFGADPRLPDEVVRTYASMYYDADPVAEAFVAEAGADARRRLEAALREGRAEGAALRALVEQIETPPAWLDARAVDLGARVFRRFGTHLYSFAGAITLEGYRECSVAKPLAFTGAYTGESANRRFLETASFWIDVAAPRALEPGGRGRAAALAVRLMHVRVRRRLAAHPAWDRAAWGVPISQADALMTLMGGSFLPGYLLRTIGYRTTREEIEALMAFWRYVGHLIGVQSRWYPATLAEALGLCFTSHLKGADLSGEDGAALARAYVDLYRPRGDEPLGLRLEKHLEHALQRGYVGWFLPRKTRARFDLAPAGLWALHPLAQAPFVFARETLRRAHPRVDEALDRRAGAAARRWIARRLGSGGARYEPVESLAR